MKNLLNTVLSLFTKQTSLLVLMFLTGSLAAQEDYQKYMSLSFTEIDSLVMIPYQKGDYNECIKFMQAGREKARKKSGKEDSTYAQYASNLYFSISSDTSRQVNNMF